VRRADHRFLFDSVETGFLEVMAYFHVNRAIRHLEALGYRGQRAIFRAPLPVNAGGTREDNSWFSPGLKLLTFGTGGVDDAEDAEIILHEFGHALQDAICSDFGQSTQAAAMGEGFGDYFAASFFAAMKRPALRPLLMSWDSIADTDHRPPYLRRVDEPATFESFDHGPDADEHDNGRIWSAALWDIRTAMGRDVADRIIIESHFQLDGFTTFARGGRAVLDADRNLYCGRHVPQLRRIFQSRGIGPVA
jgi:Zn-dependent metalloprotease